jgi:hypothetical protein
MRNRVAIIRGFALTALFVCRAPGAVDAGGGTLHAFASDGGGTAAPPDQAFVPPSTSDSAVIGGSGDLARETVSVIGSQITVSTQTRWGGGTAIASGNLSLTEDTLQTLSVHIDPGTVGPYYQGNVSLDAVGGGNVFNRFFGASNFLPPIDFSAMLAPGQYTLTWSDTGRIVAGFGGGGGFDFTMSAGPAPEPSSLVLIGVAAGCLLARRRRRKNR